jgi:hypothetical protein
MWQWYNDGIHNRRVYMNTTVEPGLIKGYILTGDKIKRLSKYIKTEERVNERQQTKEIEDQLKRERLKQFDELLKQEQSLIKQHFMGMNDSLKQFYKKHPIFNLFEGLSKPEKKKLYLNSLK